MTLPTRWPQQVIAVLLIVAAGLFVVGVTTEDDNDTHSDEPTVEAAEAGEHNEASESAETIEAEVAERSTNAAEATEETERTRSGCSASTSSPPSSSPRRSPCPYFSPGSYGADPTDDCSS